MRGLLQAMVWLAVAAAAILAGYADIDLRLVAVLACGLAALAGSGLLGRPAFREDAPPQVSGSALAVKAAGKTGRRRHAS